MRKASRPIRKQGRRSLFNLSAWNKLLLLLGLSLLLALTGIFTFYYVRFSRIIDARLSGDIFSNASLVFAGPTVVSPGQPGTAEEFAARLRKSLYAEAEGASNTGFYRLMGERLEIYPGPLSYFRTSPDHEGPAALKFANGRLSSITSLENNSPLSTYELEPEVITTLFDSSRSKRRLVRYQDLPRVLVDAVLAAEDHRFFEHHGVNFYRILAAAFADIRAEEAVQGGSTLTMQLARNFFLTPRRTIKRKVMEIFIAFLLEQRLDKKQIFELYANQIYLGQRGSFSIYGFGEASGSYFNKDVSSLTLADVALLAGLIRGPNLYSPYKYSARAKERRNWVLRRMLDNGYVNSDAAEKASQAPLGVTRQNVEATQAPFFVDMVKDQLLSLFPEHDLLSQSYRIYTTLDLDLQRAASEAVPIGIAEVDKQLSQKKHPKGSPQPEPNQPQVALVSLDPHTGAIKALVGGRDYGVSQLNHCLAKRQPGSSFKPFVYAAALSSGVDGSQPLVTTATTLLDEPTTFQSGDQVYEPENYKQEYHGQVTLREALAHSLNVATVRLAEMIGYDKVRNLAIAAGFNRDLLATPAIALGSYVATPLEVAGAYTIFANEGEFVPPSFVLAVNDSSGRNLWLNSPERRQVLDPRVSYLMVNLMESVVNNGTAAGVRSRGFTLPAAGKTGTSHDGWFAGFTTNLLAVVWVGYDDDRELKLSGAASALPVWTEYMKHAAEIPAYGKAEPFVAPPGIVTAQVDPQTSIVASAGQPSVLNEVFIEGTEPHGPAPKGGLGGILGRLFQSKSEPAGPVPLSVPPAASSPTPPPVQQAQSEPEKKKKGGIVRRFLSIFKGGDSKAKDTSQNPPQSQPDSSNEKGP